MIFPTRSGSSSWINIFKSAVGPNPKKSSAVWQSAGSTLCGQTNEELSTNVQTNLINDSCMYMPSSGPIADMVMMPPASTFIVDRKSRR